MTLTPLRALFREKDYVVYVAGNAISLTGTWIQRITVAWLVWDLTKSPLWVGLAALADLVATLLAGMTGGVLADRVDRLRFLFFMQLVSAGLALGLALAYLAELGDLAMLITARFLISASIAIVQPARMTLIPEFVGASNVNAAISFGAVIFNLAKALGPALAGLLIAYGGFGVALLANSASYLVMAATVMVLKRRRPAESLKRTGASAFATEVGRGLGFVSRSVAFRVIFLLYLVFVIAARPIEELLPALVELSFGRGVESVALLTSLLGVGSIAGALLASTRSVEGLTRMMLASGVGYTLTIMTFVLAPTFGIACILAACAGLFSVQFGTAGQTLVQRSAPAGMRGRVMSLWFVMMRGGPALGALIIGGTAELLGLTSAFIFGGVACLLACSVAWTRRATLSTDLERPL